MFFLFPQNRFPQLIQLTTVLTHVPEHTSLLVPQLLGRSEFRHSSLAENEDAVEIGNRAQTVRNNDERAVGEFLADATLDERIGCHVHSRGSLVKHHNLGSRDDSSGHAEELALALREITARFGDAAGEIPEDIGVDWSGG